MSTLLLVYFGGVVFHYETEEVRKEASVVEDAPHLLLRAIIELISCSRILA